MNNLKIENLNLKLKIKKLEEENENLLRLMEISKKIYKNFYFFQNNSGKYASIKNSFAQTAALKKYFDTYSHAVALCKTSGEIVIFNEKFKENFLKNSIPSLNVKNLIPQIKESFDFISKNPEESQEKMEIKINDKDKKELFYKISISSVKIFGNFKIILSAEDVTAEKRLEEEFYQAQKMEALGRLAGGVAHDFNNILSVILGYSSFLFENLSDDSPYKEDILEIIKATERGTAITRHLLGFSRKQTSEKKMIKIKEFIYSLEKFIKRIIGENITLSISDNIKNEDIYINDGELEQIILNLSVNAKDAMPKGGEIKISLENCELNLKEHILISFSDNGVGMSDEVKKRIFEPFFTTKEKGKGTGLGLATVYSIINKNKGKIEVESELGKGTKFKIYLPCLTEKEKLEGINSADITDEYLKGNGEKILIIDDENDLNTINKRILEKNSYLPITANSVKEAVNIIQTPKNIQLIVTDIILPDGNGIEIYQTIKNRNLEIPIIFVTGYTEDDIPAEIKICGAPIIKKPFALKEFLKTVKNVLNNKKTFV